MSCFLFQCSSWPAQHLRKRSGTCLNPCGEGEKGKEHSVSPFLHSNQKEKKKKKRVKKKSFFNQPKAATHSEKQKHQNHGRLNSKICLWTNTQPAKLGGKLAETPLNLNQVQLLIREQLLLAWQGGNGKVNTQDPAGAPGAAREFLWIRTRAG